MIQHPKPEQHREQPVRLKPLMWPTCVQLKDPFLIAKPKSKFLHQTVMLVSLGSHSVDKRGYLRAIYPKAQNHDAKSVSNLVSHQGKNGARSWSWMLAVGSSVVQFDGWPSAGTVASPNIIRRGRVARMSTIQWIYFWRHNATIYQWSVIWIDGSKSEAVATRNTNIV